MLKWSFGPASLGVVALAAAFVVLAAAFVVLAYQPLASSIALLSPSAAAEGGDAPPLPASVAARNLVPLTDQRWDRLVGNNWNYLKRSSSKDADIVVDPTAPFSPPNVLRIIFTPNLENDRQPTVHWMSLPSSREVYSTWWIKLSPNWTPSPAGSGKMTFLHLFPSGQGQAYTGLFGSTEPHYVSVNTEWAPYGARIWDPNRTTTPIVYDRWYRIEWYVRWESSPGAGDAAMEWWVNGVLNGDYSNVQLPAATAFSQFEFATTLQYPPPTEQYMYVDHTWIAAR